MSNAPVSLLSNGTSSDTDIYAPLDGNQQSIRPFRIIPGTGLLNLELKQVCLESDECPPFAALSYMWGGEPYPSRNYHQRKCFPRYAECISVSRNFATTSGVTNQQWNARTPAVLSRK